MDFSHPWRTVVSTTSYASLSEQAKFAAHNEHDKLVTPSVEDFCHGRIVFQERKHEYIGQMLDLLIRHHALCGAVEAENRKQIVRSSMASG